MKKENQEIVQQNPQEPRHPDNREHQDALAYMESQYSGPLPPAEEFEAYDRVVPGAGEKIIDSFIKQTNHRQRMEKKSINFSFAGDVIGMFLTWSVTIIIALVGGYLILRDKQIAGFATLISVIGIRIWAASRKPKKG